MITIYFMGGIGNQLFQLAFYLYYCNKYELKPIIPIIDENKYEKKWGRKFELYTLFPSLKLKSIIIPKNLPHIYEIQEYHYDNYPLYSIGIFIGYFQSIKYINTTLLPPINRSLIEKANYYTKNKNYIFIHIRRGDYTSLNRVLPVEYYKQALNIINIKTDNILLLCSDNNDTDYIKQFYNLNKNIEYIDPNLTDLEQLIIMSNCESGIIANSTFSLWACILGKKKTQVISPSFWVPNLKHVDLYYNDWIKI